MGWKAWVVAAMAIAGCTDATDDHAPTFEEFKASTFLEPWDGGVYLIDGDTPVINDKALYEQWQALYGGQPLIVNTAGGSDTVWNDVQKRALTYCVSDRFGPNKAKVLEAMRAATDRGWELRGDVNFVHASAQDASCDSDNPNVVFDINPVNVGGAYLARAFFPDTPREYRNVLIDDSAFAPDLAWPLAGILGHEVGHALGFRHEHTRPESGACFEDTNWRPLTPYDAASIMHYPECNGSADDLAFTARDADGIAALYGPPGDEPPPPPPPPPGPSGTRTWIGNLVKYEFKNLSGPIEVAPGSLVTVVMSGDGDPDLYVRFAEAPTRSLYACRPYLGANETCALLVPANEHIIQIAVDGYTESRYNITATFTAPGGPTTAGLIINEVLADPPAGYDGNGDGVASTTADEFVELVNTGTTSINLSGATLSDALAVRGTFPAGTVVRPGKAIVVFGGGAPSLPGVATLRFAPLALNNGGDRITVTAAGGAVLAEASYGAAGGRDQSLVRAVDGDGTAPWVLHTTVAATPASPGRRANGALF